MRVYGKGKVRPPIKEAKNGDLLFLLIGDNLQIQARACAGKVQDIQSALFNDIELEVSGSLTSFVGQKGIKHILIVD